MGVCEMYTPKPPSNTLAILPTLLKIDSHLVTQSTRFTPAAPFKRAPLESCHEPVPMNMPKKTRANMPMNTAGPAAILECSCVWGREGQREGEKKGRDEVIGKRLLRSVSARRIGLLRSCEGGPRRPTQKLGHGQCPIRVGAAVRPVQRRNAAEEDTPPPPSHI